MQYTNFADRMIRAVHGKIRYTESVVNIRLDDLVSPSQEAFTLLLYRNGYQKWIWLHDKAFSSSGVSDTTDGEGGTPGYQYTTQRRDLTSRNGGWSRAGMLKFNEMYKMVQENRDRDKGGFSTEYMEHCLEKKNRKRKRKRISNVVEQSLKISDDLGELMSALLENTGGDGRGEEVSTNRTAV